MVAFGFGEVLGGLLIGKIIDIWGCKKALIANLLIIIIIVAATLVSLY